MDNWIDYDLLSDSAHSNSQENRKRSTVNDSSPLEEYNEHEDNDQIPEDILENMDHREAEITCS